MRNHHQVNSTYADAGSGADPTADWRAAAQCRREDPDLFFHSENERADARRGRFERAREVCSRCVVIQQCAEYALNAREGFGIWGGMSEDERIARIVAAGGRPIGRSVHVARFAQFLE